MTKPVELLLQKIRNPRWQFTALALVILTLLVRQFWHFSGATLPREVKRVAVTVENGKILRFPDDAPQLAYLKISPADMQPVPLVEPFTGRITYNENATTRIFAPINGRIIQVMVEPGDQVKEGQALVLLDAPDYADLIKASSALRTSQSAHERAKALFAQDIIPRRALEEAENDLHQAEAEQLRAQSRLRHLRQTDQGVVLTATKAGTIMERKASPGMEISPGSDTPLLVLSNPQQVWAITEVPEQSIEKVSPGQPIQIFADAYPGEIFGGKIEGVGKVLDPQTRRILLRCSVQNPDARLKPEMYARIIAVNENAQQPKVENSALVTEGLKTFLFIETSPGVLEKREVELGFRGHDFSFVRRGLNGGERVVSSGALLLNAELAGN